MTSPENQPEPREQRIDPPHAVRPASAPAGAPVATHAIGEAGPLPLADAEPMSGQAEQLAEWLRTQHEDLAQRGEAIEGAEQEIDARVTAAKHCIAQREAELDRREQTLDARDAASPDYTAAEALDGIARRQQELDTRQASLDVATESLATERAKLGERLAQIDAERQAAQQQLERANQQLAAAKAAAEGSDTATREQEVRHAELVQLEERRAAHEASLAEREKRLAVRQREIATALERYERLGVTQRRVAELEEQAARHAERERRLAEAATLLNDQRADTARRRSELDARHAKATEALEAQRVALGAERAAWQAEASSLAKAAEAREADLDRREEALRRMQTEMQHAQREVLEMRLATEETWAQLTGLLAPAALTKSIAKVRGELADHYGRTITEIADSRGELRDSAEKLAAEFQELSERRLAREEWANRRYDELGVVAQRLEGREAERNRQQQEFERREAACWASCAIRTPTNSPRRRDTLNDQKLGDDRGAA